MASPTEIKAQITRGWKFFSDLMARDLDKKMSGCSSCGDSLTTCLYNILIGLRDRIQLNVYDETTEKLYTDMMEIIGAGDPVYGPTVDAGPDIVIANPLELVFLGGIVTAGDNPIVTTVWSQVSGPNGASFTNSSDINTGVTGLITGTYVFRLTATDSIGLTASDTMSLNVLPANAVIYYWNQIGASVPDISDILNSDFVTFVSGSPAEVPFNDDGIPMYSGIAYLLTEPIKNSWKDKVETWNNGTIGSGLFGSYVTVSDYRVSITQYPTQFQNPIIFE